MMTVLEPGLAEAVPELTSWFAGEMGEAFGGPDCADIVGDDPLLKRTRCPALVEATYLKAKEILIRNGSGAFDS
jgi:hypothetical protein